MLASSSESVVLGWTAVHTLLKSCLMTHNLKMSPASTEASRVPPSTVLFQLSSLPPQPFFTFFHKCPQLSPRPTQPYVPSTQPFPNSALSQLSPSGNAMGGLQDGGFEGRSPPNTPSWKFVNPCIEHLFGSSAYFHQF